MNVTETTTRPVISEGSRSNMIEFVRRLVVLQEQCGVRLTSDAGDIQLRDVYRTEPWISQGLKYGDYDAYLTGTNRVDHTDGCPGSGDHLLCTCAAPPVGVTLAALEFEAFSGWGK